MFPILIAYIMHAVSIWKFIFGTLLQDLVSDEKKIYFHFH